MNDTITRGKRSRKLTKDEISAIRAFFKKYENIGDAIDAIGISRPTYYAVMARKSGAPETITKINAAIAAKSLAQ